ncbi:4-hydroxy-tetrahydrodipicolinate reductase [Thermodesulfovibrio yellowstonii]|uniref:4-hydroxy-tetrahydrodipicolinate reductase n=2 Tax=Thermodesulfovibrio yellowstonii TaxID=28262 RepID=B5YGJ4_THEYD|nr:MULTISPECIES: 4-hydroxy-tetrahydrodipicolinate reductase [Thermodesulfovibrio]MBC7189387.1 4-hydroxy-tetrahydrodipicolinate reductase [Candidatus Aerophobetes bacterium]ACI20959.1 dihydrodipicolinate reductase [Thermodesulfovibrio yellowstonii DSM 11347]ACI21172.1 dihydrodipicolinate reductase [Thermodesulfovibrio yellowstonii DSM 11347]MDI6865515.1 4-hydroxy-tetrahydrodipicolinate reductase [Thermodesulfovibrio yellowstonii]GLI53012.1 4-hydroxy-tetrahydrodipicolinate reductase [Thermodesul
MIKIAVCGAAGRMGSRIVALSRDYPELKLTGAIESKTNPKIGTDAGIIAGIGEIGVKIDDRLEKAIDNADVVINFTSPEATLEHLEIVKKFKKSMVIGTTGFSNEQLSIIQKASKKIPIVLSPNMSIGVNLLFKILKDVAKVLGDDYDIEIVEAHHRMKKDAPSGTAIKMAKVIAEALNRNFDEVAVYARKGIIGERTKKEIGIQTVRAGDIVGEHTVIFGGLGERIEIIHKASSRDTFARGALRAVIWLYGKPAGFYDMGDVLGIK